MKGGVIQGYHRPSIEGLAEGIETCNHEIPGDVFLGGVGCQALLINLQMFVRLSKRTNFHKQLKRVKSKHFFIQRYLRSISIESIKALQLNLMKR